MDIFSAVLKLDELIGFQPSGLWAGELDVSLHDGE
jgi:hypothetical protein